VHRADPSSRGVQRKVTFFPKLSVILKHEQQDGPGSSRAVLSQKKKSFHSPYNFKSCCLTLNNFRLTSPFGTEVEIPNIHVSRFLHCLLCVPPCFKQLLYRLCCLMCFI
jgi:hypothetical protein